MSDTTQPSPELAAIINAPANTVSPQLEADVEKAIADLERPADREAQLQADAEKAINEAAPQVGDVEKAVEEAKPKPAAPPATRAECEAAMGAKHVEIEAIRNHLHAAQDALDGLIRLHNLLK